MKRQARLTRREKRAKYKTIANWVEAKRKKSAKRLNEELNAATLDNKAQGHLEYF